MESIIYLNALLSDAAVASITPSSRFVLNGVCRCFDFSNAKTIVEFGPGSGVLTEKLLQKIPRPSRLVAIEKNPKLANRLRNQLFDSRLQVRNDSAESVLDYVDQASVDCIISGVPFSILSPMQRFRIVSRALKALKPDGRFIAYQTYLPFKSLEAVRQPLDRYFDVVSTKIEFRNIPPLRIFEAVPKRRLIY